MNSTTDHTDTPQLPKKERRKPIARSAVFKLRIAPAVRVRLEAIADAFGVPTSTLASLAIGQFVANNERAIQVAGDLVEKIAAATGEGMGEQLKLLTAERLRDK